MYEQFYKFKENPFQLRPDTDYLYLSSVHSEALAHLVYAVQQKKGFAMLTGEIGAGKTTLCHALTRKLGSQIRIAHLVNSKLDTIGLFRSLLFELHNEIQSENKFEILRHLETSLFRQHYKRQTVLMIIDEAQNLSTEVLEEMRMLSNIETEKEKPIQILLVGQPELRARLNQPELEQLRQRITVRFHLSAMNEADTKQYVEYRIKVASLDTPAVSFTDEALREIHFYSGGIPRLVNTICDNALLAGYVKEANSISAALMQEVIAELIKDEVIRQPLQYTHSSTLGAKHFYQFRKEPFISQPDDREFMFLGAGRGDLIAQITRRIEHSSYVQAVLGPESVGKTTLAYALMESMRNGYQFYYIDNQKPTDDCLIKRIGIIAGIKLAQSSQEAAWQWEFCNTISIQLEQQKKVVIIFDNLRRQNNHLIKEIAELFRSLNFLKQLPVKFVLFGDNSLHHQLIQWQKQISAVDIYQLTPFTNEETKAYIHHRLALALKEKQPEHNRFHPFTEDAIRQLERYTAGIPLQINHLCQSALELGYLRRKKQIYRDIIEETAKQIGYLNGTKSTAVNHINSTSVK